jgi:hypothetical protein
MIEYRLKSGTREFPKANVVERILLCNYWSYFTAEAQIKCYNGLGIQAGAHNTK